jgi:TetR/AcrR family transcriptional regulator, fatty acid metabolism regulator protein
MPGSARDGRRRSGQGVAPPRRPNLRANLRDRRRAQIVTAARAIVARGGIEALSFSTLEDQLEFTRGVITYHFAGKEEIVAAVLESAVAEIDGATSAELEASASLEERIRAVLRTKVHGFLGHPEAAEILLAFWAQLAREGPVRQLTAQLFATYRAQSARLVRAARRQSPRCAADPDAMAALLVSTVIGLVIQSRFEPDAIRVEAAIEEAVQTFAVRLGSAALRVSAAGSARRRRAP